MSAVPQPAKQSIEENLARLGVVLPTPAAPVASYVGFVITGKHVFVSGQLPMKDGAVAMTGKVGKEVSLEQAAELAKLCAINILAQVKVACGGNLDKVVRCVKVNGFVNCVDGYADQSKVINGASNFIGDVFGEKGRHARAAVGVNALPMNVPVEVEAIFEIA